MSRPGLRHKAPDLRLSQPEMTHRTENPLRAGGHGASSNGASRPKRGLGSSVDPEAPLMNGMAGHASKQGRHLCPAPIIGKGAARIEGAAGGRADRIRDLAFYRNALAPRHAYVRHRIEQHAGIGMLWLQE